MYMTLKQVCDFILCLYRFVQNVWGITQSSGKMKKHWAGQKLASSKMVCQYWKVTSSCTEDIIYIGKA
jgi:hypothetical protein